MENGTLFQGRARSKLLEGDEHALRLARYLHLNPVKARIVKTPEEWEFSDYRTWIGRSTNQTTDLSLRDAFFPDGKAYETYVQFEADGCPR